MLIFRLLRSRRHRRAQSTIEFALVAPLFFLSFFGIINGGLLLYSVNALQHATDVGAAEIGAQGDFTQGTSNADQLGLQQMEKSGLDNVLLAKVSMITVQEEDATSSGTGETLTPDTRGCGKTGAGVGYPCEMQYTFNPASGTPSGWACTGTCNWPPDAPRPTVQGPGLGGTPAYALLKVNYTFSSIGNLTNFTLTASVVFRMEPQSIS